MKNRCYNEIVGASELVLSASRAEDASRPFPGAMPSKGGREQSRPPADRGKGHMAADAHKRETDARHPTPKAGERVAYHSLQDGCFWPATVMAVRADGTLDIEVAGRPPLPLLRMKWWEGDPAKCPRRCCTIKEQAEKQR